MRFWVIQMGELLRDIDGNVRDYRYMLLARELAARGHEVVRWSTTFEHISKKFRFPVSTTLSVTTNLTLRLLHAEPAYGRNISLARFRQQRQAARLFCDEADDWPKPDLIYTGVPVPEWADVSCNFGHRHGIPVVVDAQDQWPDIYITPFPRLIRPLVRTVLLAEFRRSRRLFRAARAITAVSETYLRWALERAGRPASPSDACFPLGCPDPGGEAATEEESHSIRGLFGIPVDAAVVAFAGTFGSSYDIITAVRAARLLFDRRRRDVHFVLAGDGQQMTTARQMAEGLPNVTLPGWLNQAEVRRINATAAIGLCAYSARALQSIPYKPIEYMAAGLPLLSSLRGEMAEILNRDKCGISYWPSDPASLANGICWYLDHPVERRIMGASARRLYCLRFDASVIYPAMASLLERLASSPLSS